MLPKPFLLHPHDILPTMETESHPLEPFLPSNGRTLFLGSFPPPRARWSMDFFYPNWINDFWRIMGLLFYNDRHHFECGPDAPKTFDRERITAFCRTEGLAFFDTARRVRRLKANASDNFLEIVEPTDVGSLLPVCRTAHASSPPAARRARPCNGRSRTLQAWRWNNLKSEASPPSWHTAAHCNGGACRAPRVRIR